ncbi:putative protease YdeA [Paenibacillus konkukensis]|uniref:Protease YdeA n=1 Tax=Paenibacillus konkukensis TaxID=2020716 RepID=A0ABY4RTP6_9BACL|nr:type 1 glutamine amidotransferase family protein [Paenibacillus konkukensis]UQZ85827.1 putative protease YdeA [Paenibacillus konkukensis]
MKEVWIFITDGFADWEASYAAAELNNPDNGYRVKTVAIDTKPKTSMGGFQVIPHYDLTKDPVQAEIAMLIVPGGTGWREDVNQQAARLVKRCLDNGIPVAAICDATTMLARHGFLDNVKHTGNRLEWMKQGAPDYRGDVGYIEAQSVSDSLVITANGSAAAEFTRHILEKLGVYEGKKLEEWYAIVKKGYLPE